MSDSPRLIHYYPRFLEHRSGVTESIAGWAMIARATGRNVEVWAAPAHGQDRHRDSVRLSDGGIPVRLVAHVGRKNRARVVRQRPTFSPGDIVYVHEGWTPANVVLARHARRHGATVISMPHGAYAPRVVEATRDPLRLRSRLERHLLRHLGAVHLFFESEAAEVEAVAGTSVRTGVFSNPSPRLGPGQGARLDGDYFLWIGRYDIRHKGLDLLLEGWAGLPEPRPLLRLAGPDYDGGRARVAELVAGLGLVDSVSVGRSVIGPEKDDLMASAIGYIHSSRWDACSMVLLEFMTLGTPCLVNSGVHAAHEYAARGLALTFTSSNEFSDVIPRLAGSRDMGQRAAAYMREEVSPEALAEPYDAWLDGLTVR